MKKVILFLSVIFIFRAESILGQDAMIADPVYRIYMNWDDYHSDVFRYYYTPACENISPPSDPPGIWDWGANEIPTDVTPFGRRFRNSDHYNCSYPR